MTQQDRLHTAVALAPANSPRRNRIPLATKERFIELRAKGEPISRCVKALKVGKSTLVEWNKDLKETLSALPYASPVRGRQYEELLRQELWGNEDQEYVIRSMAWRSYNDAFRGRVHPTHSLTPDQEANLARLLELLGSDDSGELLMKAEILRELGRFDECLELLTRPVDDGYLPLAKTVARLAQCKKRGVALAGEPETQGCWELFVLQETVKDETGAVASSRLFSEIDPEAVETIDRYLARFGTDAFSFLGGEDKTNRREGVWPWAIILFQEEYRLAGHVVALRKNRADFSLGAFSTKAGHSVAEAGPPSVGMLFINRKSALEEAAQRSELFMRAWDLLSDKAEDKHWICIPDPPSDEWMARAEVKDDELYMGIYQAARKP
jgi:hypothetical protein